MFIAQETAGELTQILAWWQALVALAAPIVLGLITSDATRKRIKKLLPGVVAVGATIITRFANTDVGAEVIILIPLLWVSISRSYDLLSGILSLFRNGDLSLNDILRPETGLLK